MSDTSPAFSVIVPVYDVEEYVAECLDSVLAQSFRDFELLVIDDGSTDGSTAIIARYAQQDARIHVIHQRNKGLSAARNAGMAAAQGHYCLFVDSDDVIHPQLLEICYHFLHRHKADLVGYNYANIEPHAGLPPKEYDPATMRYHRSNRPLSLLAQRHRHRIPLMAQNTCYRTALAKKHPFIEGILYEDYPHTVCLMRDVRIAISLQHELYGYTNRPGSIMTRDLSMENLSHYHQGLLSIAATYKEDKDKLSTVARIVFPEILKQIGNAIFRSEVDDATRIDMLRAFRSTLNELNTCGLLSWWGNKLRRYTAYHKLMKTEDTDLNTLLPPLRKVFH